MIDNKYVKEDLKDLTPYEPSIPQAGIFLDANESPFNIPKKIKELFVEGLDQIDFNRYPDSDCRKLKASIANFYHLTSANVALGVGSDDLIDIIFKSTISEKKILTLFPTFSMYGIYCKLNGGKEVSLKPNYNFKHEADDIIAKIKEENPLITIICNPNNPTGELISRNDIIRIIESTDNLVMVDEAYSEFSGETVSDLVNSYSNLLVLRTFSKAYSFASARLGYVLSNESFIKMLEAIKSPYRVNSVNLVLGDYIINNASLYQDNIKYIKEETNRVFTSLNDIKGIKVYPTKANFILFESEIGLFNALKDKKIFVRKFTFDGVFYIRMSVGFKDQDDLFLKEVKDYYANK